jgi:hypothetical protein
MNIRGTFHTKGWFIAFALLFLLSLTPSLRAETIDISLLQPAAAAADEADKPQPRFDIYGFAMLDNGYQFKQNDPDWFDVLRATKLPSYPDQFGKDGHWFASVRQTRLGVKSYFPTSLGELKTTFEFELFGTGVDAGQTTFRLRHAYGELGHFGAGQTWSPFMDPDVFPNSLEYWGPAGMVFFRNVQVRWMPIQGDTRLTVALERPGASGDGGIYADRIELQNVKARFPLPDLSAQFRYGQKWGYVQVAGILRKIKIDDLLADQFDLNQNLTGWGINFSSNVKFNEGNDVLRFQYVYGEGIENYMNDAPIDVGPKSNPGNPVTPIVADTLPIHGLVLFLDHTWNKKWSSTVGYSFEDIKNSDLENPSDFHQGYYALGNLLYYPAQNVMVGGEFQWGRRNNFSDDFSSNDYRIQFSFKYNFSASILGGK